MTVVGRRNKVDFKPNLLLIALLSILALGFWSAETVFAEELVSDTRGDNALCISCHNRASRILEHRKLKLNDMDKAACLQCHQPHTIFPTDESESGTSLVKLAISGNKLRKPEKSDCISCHYKYSGLSINKNGGKARFEHQPFENCANCHKDHELGEKSKLVTTQDALCSGCHVKVAQKLLNDNQHQPFAAKNCTSCHNPHYSKQKSLLVSAPKQLCGSCHLNRGESMGGGVSHHPFKQGQCTACHDPHASDNIKQLVNTPQDLCLNCHVGMARNLQKAVLHRPFGSRDCISCHQPHTSSAPKLIKGATNDQLCFNCHGDLKKEVSQESHHPVGSKIGCTSCHEPHATDYRKLQVAEGNDLCFTCHTSKRVNYRKIGHNSMQGETFAGACLNCHTPHGSAYKPLLIQEDMRLCTSCHAQMEFGDGYTHPVGEQFKDVSKGKGLTCSTTCHDPHGTDKKYNVKKRNDALCLTCHVDKLPKK